jgi:small subunit ribosomal protein S1
METDLLVELTVGDVVKATVKDLSNTYAILSIGDVDAFLPSTEYSWRKDCKLKKVLKVGSEIQAVVIKIEEQGVMLSVKRMIKDVWKNIDELYQVGQKLRGKIINIVEFGAFVELLDGPQGLLHKKEMSLDGKKKPREVVEIGQEIDVEIFSINKKERKIAFTIKPFLIEE